MRTTTSAAPATAANLSLTRLHLMRAGYLLMAVGLAIVNGRSFPRPTRCRSTRG